MKSYNHEPPIETGGKKIIIRSIGAIVLIGALSGCAQDTNRANIDATNPLPTQVHTPTNQTPEVTSSESPEIVVSAIDKNISASRVESVNIFNNKHGITEHKVYRQGNFIDLVPPVQDGVFTVVLPNKNDNPLGYSFNGTLATDSDGRIIGDLLIGGHTNSGDNWVMNEISSLKIGDTQKYTFEDATYTTVVTKITHIKKTGDAHAWPGFDKALGEDGAIFGCRLTKDSDGNTVQSGDVTIVGIKVVSAHQNR